MHDACVCAFPPQRTLERQMSMHRIPPQGKGEGPQVAASVCAEASGDAELRDWSVFEEKDQGVQSRQALERQFEDFGEDAKVEKAEQMQQQGLEAQEYRKTEDENMSEKLNNSVLYAGPKEM